MVDPIDLTGHVYGRLTVVSRAKNNAYNRVCWLCHCSCGNVKVVSSNCLRTGHTKSCGCIGKESANNFIDLTGKRFGRLKVVSRAENSPHGFARWNCVCDCGGKTVTTGGNLRRKITTSCGCYNKEINAKRLMKHGLAKRGKRHTLYAVWCSMIDRTENTNNKSWKNYGGRGIKVCERWRKSFENFLKDMGERPSKKYSIERIDNDKNYSPENCIWATRSIQANNKRSSINIVIDGFEKTLKQWCRIFGISYQTAHSRIRSGWTPKRAVTQPVKKIRKKK